YAHRQGPPNTRARRNQVRSGLLQPARHHPGIQSRNFSYALIERGSVISNPGNSTKDVMDDAARELKRLAAHLRAHLSLISCYPRSARIFRLPCQANIDQAMRNLIGLSNGIHSDPQHLNYDTVT